MLRRLPALFLLIMFGVLPSVSHAQARRVAVLDFATAAKDPAVEAPVWPPVVAGAVACIALAPPVWLVRPADRRHKPGEAVRLNSSL